MPPSTCCLRLMVIVAALVSFPVLAHAEVKERSFELALAGVLPSYTHFDTQSGLTSEPSPTVLFGYFFTKRHGAELLYTPIHANSEREPFIHTDVDVWRIGYTYNTSHREKVVSFFRFGLGRWAIDPEHAAGAPERLQSGDRNMLVYSGGGFRFLLTEMIGVRLAATVDFVDAFNGILNADIQATGEVGFTILLGGRESSPEPEEPAETPKEEQKKPEDQKKP